ncbi:hypothetical protein NE236_41655 [Actinoallomurus purpureus]|uniref:hypothetical protein n=1 Tax=Actinoallomurus purpureus TaxID=478114 RepID=UPI002092F507|nr:hypothetical protein [Actinoallomurus purpureus]MCO6011476.1 hypothetical protein [Actinoallomurus purpureus]
MNLLYLNRWRARRAYWRADKFAGRCSADLYAITDPLHRAELLDRFADAEQAMARLHPAAFGPDPLEDEGGRDLATSIASSAALLLMLAASERAAIDPEEGSRYAFWCLTEWITTCDELDLWAKLAATRDRHDRADLIDRIYVLARERVGGQAAEVLSCHAATERELAAAEASGRPPKAPKTLSSWWAVTTVVLIAAGAALLTHTLFPAGWMR